MMDTLQILERLNRIESQLGRLIAQRSIQDFDSTADVARILGKAEFTVREWARLG